MKWSQCVLERRSERLPTLQAACPRSAEPGLGRSVRSKALALHLHNRRSLSARKEVSVWEGPGRPKGGDVNARMGLGRWTRRWAHRKERHFAGNSTDEGMEAWKCTTGLGTPSS